jgi:hypothetical protein
MLPVFDDTVPDPLPTGLTVRLYWFRVKVAITFLAAVIVTVHVPVPEHPSPDHPMKVTLPRGKQAVRQLSELKPTS